MMQVQELEVAVTRRKEVIAELLQEHVQLKKHLGAPETRRGPP